MSKVTKLYTGLAGLPVCPNPHAELTKLYSRLLRKLDGFPKDSAYRKATEDISISRKKLIESELDPVELEKKLGCQCEELIQDVKKEIQLVDVMKKYKSWEPLQEKPLPDQWKWPM